MRVAVLSQNLGAKSTQPHITDSTVIALNPDLYVEMSQEDGRVPDGTPILVLQNYKLLTKVSLNGNQQTTQNIILNIYVKQTPPDIFNVLKTGSQEISPKPGALRLFGQKIVKLAHTGLGYSKGMVYAKINTPLRPILFVNMHLPMDKEELATLGLKYRQASFFNLLVKLKSHGLLDDKPLLFVGGDLNFRMDMSGHNQLNTIMKSNDHEVTKLLYGLQELELPEGQPRGITCKFSEKQNNSECRSRKIPENPTNIPEFLKTIQKNCGDPLRTPSRCDRFLVSKDVELLNVLLNTSKYILKESDHNAIMCCFEFLELPMSPRPVKSGGRTYKIKNNKDNKKIKNKRSIRNARLRNKSKVA